MKTRILIATFCFLCLLTVSARAQQLDFAFGMGTVHAPSASSASGDFFPQSVGGGLFPSFSGDVIIRHNFGINGEIAWRATQNQYEGILPFRPLFYDFNGIWVPQFGRKAAAELMAGIGAESIRFYTGSASCSFTGCTNYVSSNHFMGHFGGGIRYYVHGNFFIRPEAHLYLVHNNTDFSGARATRFSVSIGYSLRP